MFVAQTERFAGLAVHARTAMPFLMFDKGAFLDAVLAKAGTKAAMARALGLPTPRINELFTDKRRLTMEEGMRLAESFDVPLQGRVSAEMLKPVLKVCLRYAPRDGWHEQDIGRLAEEIEYGLELLQAFSTTQPSPDALDVASRAIEQRLRDKRD